MTDRYGFTFPLEGVPLSEHRSVLLEAERLGYTDAWTAEVDGYDAFVPLALAAAWTEKLQLGCAIASSISESCGTTRSTSPRSFASAASMMRPVRARNRALPSPATAGR